MPGPKPLPKNVHALRGASHLAKNHFDGTVEPDVAIPDCPRHLLPEARKFWKRITPELEQLGLISKIDQAALALAAQEWAWLVWHERALQRSIAIAESKRVAFEQEQDTLLAGAEQRGEPFTRKPWTGGDGFQVPTPNGNLTYSPNWVARNRHALLLDKFLASFGMSPSSRGRVTPSSRQLQLPIDANGPPQGFGAL